MHIKTNVGIVWYIPVLDIRDNVNRYLAYEQ